MTFSFCAQIVLLETAESDDMHRMQWIVMNRFMGSMENTDPAFFDDKFSRLCLLPKAINKNSALTVCRWQGVHCNDQGMVTSMIWRNLSKKQRMFFDIRWLPPTLTRVNMEMVLFFQEADIRTKALPKTLIFCMLTRTGLHGRIDLQTLPKRMRTLDLSHNEFEGTVSLGNLPSTIEKINFRNNSIRKVLLFNDRLPDSLQYALFYQVNRKVKIVCLDGKVSDLRVMQEDLIELHSSSSSEDSDDSSEFY